jgi:RNA-splicing ligase RtcB
VKKEALWAYKDVSAVVETQTVSGAGRVVVELRPVLTAKG